ncbi:MAG: SCO family protein [Chloroflexota bacterium]
MLKFRPGVGIIIAVITVLSVGGYYWLNKPAPISILDEYLAETPPPMLNDVFIGEEAVPPIPMPVFDLINYDGKRIANKDLKGRLVLMTFAYTSCPDTCPIIFGRFLELQKELGDAIGSQVELVFLTVDPEVDTQERLAAHVNAMNGKWYYLTEDLAVMQKAWEDLGVYVEKEDPIVNHSNLTYLIDDQGLIRVQYIGMPPASAFLSDINKILNK